MYGTLYIEVYRSDANVNFAKDLLKTKYLLIKPT